MAVLQLTEVFRKALQISEEQVRDDLQYNTIPQWDSVGHMSLVAEIESRFGIMLDTDEILGMSSFAKAREILQHRGIDGNA
jgi:acyl carrier protein